MKSSLLILLFISCFIYAYGQKDSMIYKKVYINTTYKFNLGKVDMFNVKLSKLKDPDSDDLFSPVFVTNTFEGYFDTSYYPFFEFTLTKKIFKKHKRKHKKL